MKSLKYISFGLLAVISLLLAIMTAGCHLGWPLAVYTSWPLVALWTILAVASAAFIFKARLYRRPVVFTIHAAMLLILAGAAVTHFCSSADSLTLPADGTPVSGLLPVPVAVESFTVETYPGSEAPRDYVCRLRAANGERASLSLNSPADIAGYRFIIQSYTRDASQITFRVVSDPWGCGISYAGYLLLALSFIIYFFLRKSEWRSALRRLAPLFLILLSAFSSRAEVSPSFASGFAGLPLLYNDRVAPASTLARDFTSTITGGASSYKGRNADRILAGFIFDFSTWKQVPVIRIKSAELRDILGISSSRASYEEIFNAVASGRLDIDNPDIRKKFAADLDRFETVNMVVSGEALKLFPIKDPSGRKTVWLSPTDNIPPHISADQWIFIRKYLGLLNEQVQKRDEAGQTRLIEALDSYQRGVLKGDAPSRGRLRLESLYNSLSAQRWPPVAVAVVGLILYLMAVFGSIYSRVCVIAGYVFAIIALLSLTALIIMRGVVSGHLPLANGYETMQFLSWLLLAVAVSALRRPFLLSVAVLAAGMAWGVAVLGGTGSTVSGMMPVLDSPLLSVHVVLVMASYALFMLMTLTAVAGLVRPSEGDRMQALIYVLLYPALALLAMGIFIGAVWANVSWGRYWGWDPKEVWALITLFVYSFAAHPRLLPFFRKPRRLFVFTAAAFISVLITYFGVNFLLGGLHSYA